MMGGALYLMNLGRIVLDKLARKLKPSSPSFSIEKILHRNFPESKSFYFIQVGANDGVSNDFLFEFVKKRNPAGITIEPLKEAHESLKRNYENFPGVKTVNKAVHKYLRKVTLYKVNPSLLHELPAWASGIASLDPQHHRRSGTPSDAIVSEEADAAPLMEILNEHDLPNTIDLLQIDVEGYDLEVLKQVDFSIVHPLIVRMEYINLPLPAVEEAVKLLKSHGYYVFYEGMDITGVDLKRVKL
jgi:FkbM family methyltransferase